MLEDKIILKDVTKSFTEGTTALERLSMEVRSNEILCLLGPSGCGKSTVLNLIAGFEFPTSGEVRLDGKPIGRPGPDRGVVFQEHALFPWLNAIEPHWIHAKRKVGEADRLLPASELRERICDHFGCPQERELTIREKVA